MAWWKRLLVVLVVLVPPVLVLAVTWPSAGADGAGDDDGGAEREIAGELVPGDEADGQVDFGGVAVYTVTGSGEVRIGVRGGGGMDATITVVEAGGGDQLAYNDDTNGLDPEVTLDLEEGEPVEAEVRSLSGQPGGFTISVDE